MTLSPRLRKTLIIAAAVVVVYGIVGFLVLPPIVRAKIEQQASAVLGRHVTVESVRLNPFTLSATLQNFAIAEADGRTRFLGWQRLYVNFNALSSLWGEWVLSDVELDGLYARGVLNADQTLNVSDILRRFSSSPPTPSAAGKSTLRPIRVDRLVVKDARVEASDLSRKKPFTTAFGPLSFELTKFRTVAERGAPYRFQAVSESGEKLAWAGTLRAEPFQSEGDLTIENLLIPKYAPYYADLLRGDVSSGTLSIHGTYVVDLTANHRVLTLKDGNVQLRQFALRDTGAEASCLELPMLEIGGINADALKMKAEISKVTISGAQVRAERAADGTLNVLRIAQPLMATPSATPPAAASASSGATATAAASPAPDVTVADVQLTDCRAEWADLTVARPAKCVLNGLQLSLKHVTLAPGAQIPLQLAFGWDPQGTVRVDGTMSLKPLAADVKVLVDEFTLAPLSPYIESFANVHLAQGTVATSLTANLALPEGKAPELRVAGDLSLRNVGLLDAAQNQDLAGFAEITLRGLKASAATEMGVSVDEVQVVKPYARASVAANGSINVANLAKSWPPGQAPAPASVAAAEVPPATTTAGGAMPKIEIGRIAISDGDFRFGDASLSPTVGMAVTQFGGTLSHLSSTNPGKGEINLKALVDGAGPVAITGKFDALGAHPNIDMKVDVKNVDLVPLTPYAGKYAGYELARGKLAVDVNLRVNDRKIDSANVITLNQFTFGNPVASPEATKLPVRLAVALLKDLDGKIVIDVPIQGSLDDPDFKIGRVVLRVIVNLLTKAAVSPFSLLGAAFGGGGNELAYQEFAPGEARLQATEMKKLDTMITALTNRPGLNLDLEGCYDSAADSYALKRIKLADRVRREIWQSKRAQNPNLPPPAQLTISAEENAAMIKQLFDQTFPPGTQFGTPVPPAPAVVAPPPPAARGWFQRIVRAITFADRRAARQAAQENALRQGEHEKAVAAAVAAGLPLEEMTGRLAEAMTVDQSDLDGLARARAEHVRDYLRDTGKISPDRLFLAKAATEATKESKGPRVFLTLE